MCGPHFCFGDLSPWPHRCWEEYAESKSAKENEAAEIGWRCAAYRSIFGQHDRSRVQTAPDNRIECKRRNETDRI